MAKFFGIIGFGVTEETSPGVWTNHIIEKRYYGDIINNSFRHETREQINDDLIISNKISIISDPYAISNTGMIKYVSLYGTKWKVSNVEISYPRLILTLGGMYNGPTQ